MRRKIYDKMLKWKNSRSRSALLIDGARRVGKSYIAEKFARENYRSYVMIDFNNAPKEVMEVFENYLNDLDSLFLRLSTYYKVKLYKGDTLFIFDEVQMFPKARGAIKYLVADGRYDFIETGSLMSIKKNVKDITIPSEETHICLYPMDFEEFMWALGDEAIVPYIKDCFDNKKPMGQLLHRRAMDYFREYMIVGGMPQAVKTFTETKDFEETDLVKRNILRLYRDDIAKHSEKNELEVEAIFDEIPAQLSKHEKKFKLSDIKVGANMRKYRQPFNWLADAMIVNNCYNSTEPNIGLKLNMERKTLKCYMADTGLLISHAFDENGIVAEEIYKKLLFDKLTVNNGMILENIVAQMLTAAGHRLYFYSKSSREKAADRMEIDFLIAKSKVTNKHNISPIEVKSGDRYTLSSINKFRRKFAEYVNVPYVIHTKDLKEEDGIVYLPVYMTMFL